MSSNSSEQNNEFVQALRKRLKGQVRSAADRDFESSLGLWNGAIDARPIALARCQSAVDVQQAVMLATEYEVPISVLGGGHDWAGRSVCANGLTIDLRSMNKVSVNPAPQTAVVQGGATAGNLLEASDSSLVAVTGTTKAVGLAGLTLGGGYGPLNGRFGLAVDNLLSAEVVLADGTIANASESHDTELLWALRGGGGNFGVVTSFTVRMHSVQQVLSALILYPLNQAETILHSYQEIIDRAPDELGLLAGFLAGPDGSPMLFLYPLWSGETAAGELVIDELLQLGNAILVQRGWTAYRDALGLFDPLVVNGRHHFIETRSLSRFNDLSIASLVHWAERMTSSFSAIVIHDFHGAATRVPVDSAAFPLRSKHLVVEIISAWDAAATGIGQKHREWAKGLSQDLTPHALPGGYVNLLGVSETERVKLFYSDAISRLLATKKRVDPNNHFKSAVGSFYETLTPR